MWCALRSGYAYDRSQGSLLSQFAPEHLHLATTSGPQATGDGVRLGQTAGASLVDMDQVQARRRSLGHSNQGCHGGRDRDMATVGTSLNGFGSDDNFPCD